MVHGVVNKYLISSEIIYTKTLFENLRQYFGNQFGQVFKNITSDNDLEFAELSSLEQKMSTKVYFIYLYAYCEYGTNEIDNGMVR